MHDSISIITVNYRSWSRLKQCLDSVYQQWNENVKNPARHASQRGAEPEGDNHAGDAQPYEHVGEIFNPEASKEERLDACSA